MSATSRKAETVKNEDIYLSQSMFLKLMSYYHHHLKKLVLPKSEVPHPNPKSRSQIQVPNQNPKSKVQRKGTGTGHGQLLASKVDRIGRSRTVDL